MNSCRRCLANTRIQASFADGCALISACRARAQSWTVTIPRPASTPSRISSAA